MKKLIVAFRNFANASKNYKESATVLMFMTALQSINKITRGAMD